MSVFYKSTVTREQAITGDAEFLRQNEDSLAFEEERVSLWQAGVMGRPTGVYPSSFHGAAIGRPPYLFVATAYDQIREGLDGMFYHETIEGDGSEMDESLFQNPR